MKFFIAALVSLSLTFSLISITLSIAKVGKQEDMRVEQREAAGQKVITACVNLGGLPIISKNGLLTNCVFPPTPADCSATE
jgi:hypothetical protein